MAILNGMVCDNQKCDKGERGVRSWISWDADAVKEDPLKMPDQFFRFVTWQPVYEEPKPGQQPQAKVYQFCSVECNREFFKGYVPPRSPREQAEIEASNRAVDAKRKQDLEGRAAKREGAVSARPTDEAVTSGGMA